MNKVRLKKNKNYFIDSLQVKGKLVQWEETPTSTKVWLTLDDGDTYETTIADLSK